jgi:hypothetical protein
LTGDIVVVVLDNRQTERQRAAKSRRGRRPRDNGNPREVVAGHLEAIRSVFESIEQRKALDEAALVIAETLSELLPEGRVTAEVAEHAARLAASETAWRAHLDLDLDTPAMARLLGMSKQAVAKQLAEHRLIGLRTREGGWLLPAWQVIDGRPSPALSEAFWSQVEQGGTSPWTVASWCVTPHPELDGLSPVRWTAQHKDPESLLLTARRDASVFAQ